ncbi:MAG: acetyl-CoA C-acyltransferase [Desulfosporosinus sp.]|nr:acetyl-CoA C-acyltransferase [Desulfosporosinus sp.]
MVKTMREAVIVQAVRTPVGKKNGSLSGLRSEDLAGLVLRELVKRAGVDPAVIEDVLMGCVSQVGEQAFCIGRQAALIADYPQHVPGLTIDRQCGSSQQAVHFAAQAILAGDMDVIVAAGIENMSRIPMGSTFKGIELSKELTSRYEIINQGLSAERIAEKWSLSRQQMDEFSLESHKKALSAQEEGRFEREIMPVSVVLPEGSQGIMKIDEGPRRDTSLEKLSGLKAPFMENGQVTAGNTSQISDGAAAMLIMSREKAEELGLKPRFRIVARSVIGSDPTLMLTGPIPATAKVLAKAGLSLADIDIFEVNEAFAAVPLAWLIETGADPKKLNPNGGAIALGHPLGASGARLMTTMMYELERTGGMGVQGYLCPWLEEKYGGSGADFGFSAIISEELARAGVGIGMGLHSDIIAPYIQAFGTEKQKLDWLPACARGEKILALAMTEPQAGSDLQGMKATAVRDGDEYIINGSKTFISNGILADLVIVATKTDSGKMPASKGISLIVVEDGTPGFTKCNKMNKLGMHSQDTAELFLKIAGCR